MGAQSEKTARAKSPELKVVFDSSVIFTGSASDLVNPPVAQFIADNSTHPDLKVSWYFPEVVVLERRYQMVKKGFDLLPSVQRLETLLGHNLNVTSQIIENRVDDAIQRALKQLNLGLVCLSYDQVDWGRLIQDATFRRPPFDTGEKEKGFRDSVIVESFLQLVEASPSTPRICRVSLLTGDKLISDAVTARTTSRQNVRILGTLDELKSLINTLIAAVSEEVVARIREQAGKYFFVPKQEDTLYYTEGIRKKITDGFPKELVETPSGADRRENGTWFIGPPGFVKKEGQRITWSTTVEVEAKAFKRQPTAFRGGLRLLSEGPSVLGLGSLLPPTLSPERGEQKEDINRRLMDLFTGKTAEEALVAEGRSFFAVIWSHLVSTNQKFRSPKIDDIRFLKTDWETKEK